MTFKPPFGLDKIAHFSTVFAATALVGVATDSLPLAIIFGAGISVGKEIHDLTKNPPPPLDACLRDLAADTLGIIAAAAVLLAAPLFV